MDLSTIGSRYYIGYHHHLWFNPVEEFVEDMGLHTRYRIILVESGNGILAVDDQSFPLVSPALYCFNQLEKVSLRAGSNIHAKSLYFHPEVVNRKFDYNVPFRSNPNLSVTDEQEVWLLDPFIERSGAYYGLHLIEPWTARHVSKIMDDIGVQLMIQSDQNWPCRSRSYLQELLFLIRRLYSPSGTGLRELPIQSNEYIDSLLQYLHTHIQSKITLDGLAGTFHTNKTTLNQYFKKHTGLPIITYVNQLRMQIASTLLRNTLLPIEEIMHKVGIQDHAHFIRNYRKFSGFTPANYRNQHRNL